MIDDGAARDDRAILGAVGRARVRLAQIAGRELLRQRAWWVVGGGAALAVCRPLVFRLADDAPRWTALARSLGFFAAGSAAAAVALVALGRRRGPGEPRAARAVDEALGLHEVVASGFAFVRDAREQPLERLARRRAGEALAAVRVEELFPLPSLRPRWRGMARFALCAAVALAAGSYDRGLVLALMSPPTAGEADAAADLEEAAAELAEHLDPSTTEKPHPPPTPGRDKGDDKGGEKGPTLADTAREAARAAKRGDRRGALDKLEGVRAAGARQGSRADGIGAALRKMAEALDPLQGKSGSESVGRVAPPSASAAESMRLLAQKLRSPEGTAGGGDSSKERILERLERAGEEARRAAADGRSQGASDAARALSRAAEALGRGDHEAAAQALEQAAARAEALEEQRAAAAREAMAVAEMLEKSGALERAIQMAMLGREGSGEKGAMGPGLEKGADGSGENGEMGTPGSGRGAGATARSALLARLAALGATAAKGDPGTVLEPHIPDRHRAHRDPLVGSGALQAPSQVTEGARAVQAIRGLGRGSDPPASYREVFPSYDAAAEEGIADEHIPAPRRAAVRRYFQSIRPDQP
jgi:hypothetical protein